MPPPTRRRWRRRLQHCITAAAASQLACNCTATLVTRCCSLVLLWDLVTAAAIAAAPPVPAEVGPGFTAVNSGAGEAWLGAAAARPVLASPDGAFALAFVASRNPAGPFTLSLVSLQRTTTGSVVAEEVWSASAAGGGAAVATEGAVLSLTAAGLQVTSPPPDGTRWVAAAPGSATAAAAVAGMRLLESGNLVLLDAQGRAAWASFDRPTHTLLPGQNFTAAMRLTTSQSADADDDTDAAGAVAFSLTMRPDGMALWASSSSSPPAWPWVYWEEKATQEPRWIDAAGPPIYARLDPGGFLGLYQTDSRRVHMVPLRSYGMVRAGVPRRLKLESDGNLLAYYWDGRRWRVDFQAVRDACGLPSPCGPYGICSSSSSSTGGGGGTCRCPAVPFASGDQQPFAPRWIDHGNDDDDDAGTGSTVQPPPPVRQPAARGGNVCGSLDGRGLRALCVPDQRRPTPAMVELVGVDQVANRFAWPSEPHTPDACARACLANCSCVAAFFHNRTALCFHHSAHAEPGSLLAVPDTGNLAYLKLVDAAAGSKSPATSQKAPSSSSRRLAVTAVFTVAVLSLAILLLLLLVHLVWRYRDELRTLVKGRRSQDILLGSGHIFSL